ncbi:hypothetical protein ACSBR2_000401 [Camellia fascicularis]
METFSHSREFVDFPLTQQTHQTSRSQKPPWPSSRLSTTRACRWQSSNSLLAALTHHTPTHARWSFFS